MKVNQLIVIDDVVEGREQLIRDILELRDSGEHIPHNVTPIEGDLDRVTFAVAYAVSKEDFEKFNPHDWEMTKRVVEV